VLRLPAVDGRLDPAAVLRVLAARGITRLMVEAGPIVVASFIRADLVDEAVVFRAPSELGADAIGALDGMPLSALTQSGRLRRADGEPVGVDIMETFERA
jgi:diaminohydroxyphosphoribosylaminopyrimidine deaminase/5-amino-6-(5-phosphoribosylamino)uracil reductase